MGCVGLYEHASGSENLTRGVAENFIAEGNFSLPAVHVGYAKALSDCGL